MAKAPTKLPSGMRSKIAKAVGNVIELVDGRTMKFTGIGKNVAKADHIPIFRVGGGKNLKGKSAEYMRQLQRQVDGLNSMTPKELLENMKTVTRGGLAQDQARKLYQDDLERKIFDSLRKADPNLSRSAAREAAQKEAKDRMSLLAALHEPDIVAGGKDVIGIGVDGLPSMGDKFVNSSIGSQWKSRRQDLIDYAESLVKSGLGDQKINASFVLE